MQTVRRQRSSKSNGTPSSLSSPFSPNDSPSLSPLIAPFAVAASNASVVNDRRQTPLAGIYKNVVSTDTSAEQLSFAKKLPNIRYQQRTPTITVDELKANVAPRQAIDLVTVAQAFHWFDCPTFYQRVKGLLKRPNGVLAIWCYTLPRINNSINNIVP